LKNVKFLEILFTETPFGQMPILHVDGKVLAQSMTIARYLAKQHGLAGQNDWEEALANMYVDCISDLIKGNFFKIKFQNKFK
jgi:glutathione S-transferase